MKIIILLIISFQFAYASDVNVSDAQIRLVPPVSTTTAMFLKIKNNSKNDQKLIKITSPISDEIELHEMKMDNGKMIMRSVESILIKSNSEVELKAGGLHAMIFSLKKPLKENDIFPMTLEFQSKEKLEITAKVVRFN